MANIKKAVAEYRANRSKLTEARAELLRVSERDRDETPEYLAAIASAAEIQDSLPWWQRWQ